MTQDTDRDVRHLLRKCWEQNICPNCGETIPEGTRVGSGRKADGGFCSLRCYAEFHEADLLEKARMLTSRLRN